MYLIYEAQFQWLGLSENPYKPCCMSCIQTNPKLAAPMSSAFKSTTKRAPILSPVAKSRRRSRSLSRFSRRASTAGDYETPARRAKFVNTSRGSAFPDINLDDLVLDVFESADRWRSGDGSAGVGKSWSSSSQRRGRSVSRHGLRRKNGVEDWSRSNGGGSVAPASVKARRRSFSAAPYRDTDTDSEVEASHKLNNHINFKRSSIGNGGSPSNKPAASNQPRLSGRSKSLRGLRKLHNGYSSQSSTLTDEEPPTTGFGRKGAERTIRTVYAQKAEHPIEEDINTGLYNAMRKEFRNVVEDIRLELEQAMLHNYLANISGTLQSLSAPTEKSGAKFDQRSNDRHRLSKELIQEAEEYFEDFISNVDDTDLSSFEGERSDCDPSIGRIKRSSHPLIYCDKTDIIKTPGRLSPIPVEMDGVVLPWLQWETSNDTSPASGAASSYTPLDGNAAHGLSNHSISRSDSCSPVTTSDQSSKLEHQSSCMNKTSIDSYKTERSKETSTGATNASYFDMDDYTDIAKSEELMMESWKKQYRISSSLLLLCSRMFV
uniref:Uncharacterized protein n=1 Tax=Kalanchoe fedtschenkoi TaxID=63787 RepID=A0A7N0TZW8_KALFE